MKPYLIYSKLPAKPTPRNKYVVNIHVVNGPNADKFSKVTKLTEDEFDSIVDLLKEIHELPTPDFIEHSIPCKMPFSRWMGSFCGLQNIGSATINNMIDTLIRCLPATGSQITPHGYAVTDLFIKYFDADGAEHSVEFKK